MIKYGELDKSIDKSVDNLIEMTNLDGDKSGIAGDKTSDSILGKANEVAANEAEEEFDFEDASEDAMTEVSVYELGTFDLKINYDSQYHKIDKSKAAMKEEKFNSKSTENLCLTNIIEFLNHDNTYDINFVPFKKTQDILFYFTKEITEYQSFQIIDPVEFGIQQEAKKKNADPTKDIMEYRNTNNSFINLIQKNHCLANNFLGAFDLNRNYQEKKKTYEIELLKKILGRFEEPDKRKEIIAQNLLSVYETLKSKSVGVIKSYEEFQNSRAGSIKDIQYEAYSLLVAFVNGIKKEAERDSKSPAELKKTLTYTLWKKRFSELINIWDLYSSNGIELKFTYKYLILKQFYSSRAYERMNNIVKDEEKKSMSLIEMLCGADEDPFKTLSIYQPKSGTRIFLNILLTFAYIYSSFTIALRFWIPNFDSTELESVERTMDILFLFDMMFSIRTIYRDKSNNDIEDLTAIFKRYSDHFLALDLITIIPWEIFLMQTPIFDVVKQFRNICKIMRINKISIFLAPLETTTLANFYRLMKIIIFYLIIVFWEGSLIIYTVNDSLAYDKMGWDCYNRSWNPGKTTLKSDCAFLLGVYHGPYMIIGRDSTYFLASTQVYPSKEYLIYILEFAIGVMVSTYILGGITDILKNLNQGENFFTAKTDLLVEHMVFYEVSEQTQVDLKVYYDYLWQRHKDIIYGKGHFAILSRSLRERFEILNLPNNNLYLAKFYNLNLGSNKLVGKILMNLEKKILFPYEILFEEGSVCKGLYVLLNGDIELVTVEIPNVPPQKFQVEIGKIMAFQKEKTNAEKVSTDKLEKLNEDFSVIFPLTSVLIKTGRIWQRSYSEEFSDLLFLPIETFDELVENFPIEIHSLKHAMFEEVVQKKVFDNEKLFKVVGTHSSRSTGKYYEKDFNKVNIWIPIAIPISQRKIAKNYIDCFMKKVRNQYREINLSADLNISLMGFFITRLLNKTNKKKVDGTEVKAASMGKTDRLEIIKGEFANIDGIVSEIAGFLRPNMDRKIDFVNQN